MAERIEFYRVMQQRYPRFNVTIACTRILYAAALWTSLYEKRKTWRKGFPGAPVNRGHAAKLWKTEDQLYKWQRAYFSDHPAVFSTKGRPKYRVYLGSVPVPTSRMVRTTCIPKGTKQTYGVPVT